GAAHQVLHRAVLAAAVTFVHDPLRRRTTQGAHLVESQPDRERAIPTVPGMIIRAARVETTGVGLLMVEAFGVPGRCGTIRPLGFAPRRPRRHARRGLVWVRRNARVKQFETCGDPGTLD